MQAIQKLFIGFVAFCLSLGAAVGVFLYVAATPYIWIIGKFVAGLLITILVCASCYSVVWTWTEMSIRLSKRKQARNAVGMVSAPADKHSIYLQPINPGYTIHEVSANIAAASVPRMLPAPPDEKPVTTMPDETIIDLYRDGNTLEGIMTIAKSMGAGDDVKYNRVQRVVKQAKADGKVY